MDKLPKVYQNPIDHSINNDQKTFVSFLNGDRNSKSNNFEVSKIDKILNDAHHIIKSNVRIITDTEDVKCMIISRTNTHVITIDNKKIPISSIRDIKII